jgi:beta-glucanase (GH16 family)
MKTQGKFEHTKGRFEARIQIPKGQGLWPAFWMLGNDIGTAGWPTCGEIDIMENIGKEPSTVHGTIHGPGYSGGNGIGAPDTLAGGAKFADDFHLFAIEWDDTSIRWFVDSNNYETRTPADLPAGKTWVYDHPFFMLLNVAVGGQWPGNPDGTTTFPQTMKVDYVRVYDKG